MKLDKHIEKEVQEIAPILSKLDKTNFYEVQEGYFAGSQTKIMEMIEESEAVSPVLSAIPKKELYAAPAASYFGSFSENLIAKVHAEEVAEELSYALPIIQHVEKKETYKVPTAYFASFPEAITRLAKKESIEHSSPIDQWNSKWNELIQRILGLIARPRYSFAMASVVGMIVCIGLVVNTQNTLSEDEKIFAQMQQLPDADLHHYIDRHRDEFDEHIILHNINDVEFTHYSDKPEQVTPNMQSRTKGVSDDDISSDDILD